MNQHITEYVAFYLSQENTDYALMLSGKWGCGKTYFINKYLENNHKALNGHHFVRISLFGLKHTSDIDDQIFQSIHPILGSKYIKLAGNILKSATRVGINFDFNSDGKHDGTAAIDTKEIKFLDFFSINRKKGKELVFIFDDVERTLIDLSEILGYINNIVEILFLKP